MQYGQTIRFRPGDFKRRAVGAIKIRAVGKDLPMSSMVASAILSSSQIRIVTLHGIAWHVAVTCLSLGPLRASTYSATTAHLRIAYLNLYDFPLLPYAKSNLCLTVPLV